MKTPSLPPSSPARRFATCVALALSAGAASAQNGPAGCGWTPGFSDDPSFLASDDAIEFDVDGDGALELVAVGSNLADVAVRDDGVWSSLQGTLQANTGAESLIVHDGELYLLGALWFPVGRGILGRWTGSDWERVGPQVFGKGRVAEVYQGDLHVGGQFEFTSPNGVCRRIARWDEIEGEWFPLAGGFEPAGFVPANSGIYTLAVFDGELYAGGTVRTALDGGGKDVLGTFGIARWNGAEWSALDQGFVPCSGICVPNSAYAMATYDEGAGSVLFVGGAIVDIIGIAEPANHLARWDGAAWSLVEDGLGSTGIDPFGYVNALVIHNDGTGPSLYAGGDFWSAGSISVNNLARWDGAGWHSIGGGIEASGSVRGLESTSTADLIVCGFFDVVYDEEGEMGPVDSYGIARWEGSCAECFADIDGDGTVGFGDLTLVLANWGPCAGCPADLDGDGNVGFSDLTLLLSAWGPCP